MANRLLARISRLFSFALERDWISANPAFRNKKAALTNWSFEQLAGIAAAPPKYLRTLPAAIASDAINYGLRRQRREEHQLLVDRDDPWTVHAVTSPRYARVHHDELAGRVLDLMAQHPAWPLPLGLSGRG